MSMFDVGDIIIFNSVDLIRLYHDIWLYNLAATGELDKLIVTNTDWATLATVMNMHNKSYLITTKYLLMCWSKI